MDTDTGPGTWDARPRDRFPVLPSFPGPASGPGPGDGGAPPHVVVVGGGIAGLTAAARLSGAVGEAGARARVTGALQPLSVRTEFSGAHPCGRWRNRRPAPRAEGATGRR